MSRRSQLGGQSSVVSLHNGFVWNSSSGLQMVWPGVSLLSGACTAGVWKTILSITGSKSRLNALVMAFNDATARTGRLRITFDGRATPAFDASVANAGGSRHVAVGQIIVGTTSNLMFQPLDANQSLLVEYQGDLTETDKATFIMNYEVRQ